MRNKRKYFSFHRFIPELFGSSYLLFCVITRTLSHSMIPIVDPERIFIHLKLQRSIPQKCCGNPLQQQTMTGLKSDQNRQTRHVVTVTVCDTLDGVTDA